MAGRHNYDFITDEDAEELPSGGQHNQEGFCYNLGGCDCHEDQGNITDLYQAYQDGLASSEDLENIYHGRTV